jgi:hypothetical protein
MKVILSILIIVTLAAHKPLGAGVSTLTGKSSSARTLLYIEMDDIMGGLQKAELIVDGKKLAFTDEDKSTTVFDSVNGVLTLYLTGNNNAAFPNGRFIRFWAIPKTFKTVVSRPGHRKYEFKGRIEATEPRKGENFNNRIPQVEMDCTLDYEL